jgi:pimeloyl-ACP methyl ester carboxylesterase
MNRLASAWRGRGKEVALCGRSVFTVDVGPTGPERRPPLLALHGFPTSSFDFHQVVDGLATDRRVLLFDMLGYGLSEKPDTAYTVAAQADVAMALVARLGVVRLGLLTHDVGDTVGGELLARQLEGAWDVEITDRALTNGSIYVDLARLSDGQLLLLALPDERLTDAAAPDRDAVVGGIAATFSSHSSVDDAATTAQWQMIAHLGGERLLPRLIRYVEERRLNERRFTGAIERHPSPLSVVWGGDDPIAVPAMTERLRRARPDLRLAILDGVGHYPMVEAPDRFLGAMANQPIG